MVRGLVGPTRRRTRERLAGRSGRVDRLHTDVAAAGSGRGSAFALEAHATSGDSPRRGEPAEPADQPAARIDPCSDGLRVLVVEDDEDSACALVELLQPHCEVRAAADGLSCLEQARAMRPHVVLLDLGLPDMSGLDVARALRADPELAEVRLIALTGFGDAQSLAQIRDARFDHHVLKPIDFDALLRLIQS